MRAKGGTRWRRAAPTRPRYSPTLILHTALEITQGQIHGFFSQLIFKCYLTEVASVCTRQRSWYFIAKQPAPAPHLANPEGCDALRIVQAGSRAKGTTLWRKEAPTRPRYSPREMR